MSGRRVIVPAMKMFSPVWMVAALALLLALGVPIALVALRPAENDADWFGKPWVGNPTPYRVNLTDQSGQRFELASLRGKIVLVVFGFTHCPGICPATVGHLASALSQLSPPDRERVQVVFVSIDPERDSPERLREFLSKFDGPFVGLTGSRAEIAAVAKAFRVSAQKPAEDSGAIDHTTDVTLIDPAGRLRLVYAFDQVGRPDDLAGDLRKILGETR